MMKAFPVISRAQAMLVSYRLNAGILHRHAQIPPFPPCLIRLGKGGNEGGFCLIRVSKAISHHMLRYGSTAAVCLFTAVLLLAGCSDKGTSQPKGKASAPVPVMVGTIARKAMPVQLKAIGAVEAYATVAVKARVDGQIVQAYFKEGQEVRQGDPLFDIDPRPFAAQLRQAEANLARDQATLDNARTQERRYQDLLQKKLVAKDQYDQIRTGRETAEANVRADQAAIENAKLQLEYSQIRSPINGRTGKIMIQPGNLVKANDVSPLVTINQVNPIYVSFSIPEQYLGEIRRRMSADPLRVQATLPETGLAPVSGRLDFIDNQVDAATGTIRLKAVFQNQDRTLWPGQFVHVVLTLYQQPDAVVAPSQSIQTGPNGQYVFVVKPDMTAEVRPITVDRSQGDETVITKGIAPGERVVTTGQSRLTPGAKVNVKSGSNPEANKA
jgi:multidrug efflux system membrane fusion protein